MARVAAAYMHPDRGHVPPASGARCVGRRGAQRERLASLGEGLPCALGEAPEKETGELS